LRSIQDCYVSPWESRIRRIFSRTFRLDSTPPDEPPDKGRQTEAEHQRDDEHDAVIGQERGDTHRRHIDDDEPGNVAGDDARPGDEPRDGKSARDHCGGEEVGREGERDKADRPAETSPDEVGQIVEPGEDREHPLAEARARRKTGKPPNERLEDDRCDDVAQRVESDRQIRRESLTAREKNARDRAWTERRKKDQEHRDRTRGC
jgi:hypothetical protein